MKRHPLVLLVCLATLAFTAESTARFRRAGGNEEAPDFPTMEDFAFADSLYTKVEVKDNQAKTIGYAEEYYDLDEDEGRLNVLSEGKRMTIIYYNSSRQILFLEENKCDVSAITNSPFAYGGIYEGWQNITDKQIIIGPSALLRKPSGKKTNYIGERMIRGIQCNQWDITEDGLAISYYVSAEKRQSPFDIDAIASIHFPVRVTLSGNKKTGGKTQTVDQVVDFVFFQPYVDNWQSFQPSTGIGCKGKLGNMPFKVPDQFYLIAEEYTSNGKDEDEQININVEKIWYDKNMKLARMDSYLKSDSVLLDFNTGVSYTISNNMECTIEAIQNTVFESFPNGLVGDMLNPLADILDNRFYSVGKQYQRGIQCSVWESVKENVTIQGRSLAKAIYTLYLSTEKVEIAAKGTEESQIPIRIEIAGYNKNGEKNYLKEMNIYSFLNMSRWEQLRTFDISACFPFPSERSYYSILMPVQSDIMEVARRVQGSIHEYFYMKIPEFTGVSLLRMPYLAVEYFPNDEGIRVTGLMLERPPYLASFNLFAENISPFRNDELAQGKIESAEACAQACVMKEECKSIYYCGKSKCYISTWNPEKPRVDPRLTDRCTQFIRSVRNSKPTEPYLKDALQKLQKAKNKMVFKVQNGANIAEFKVNEVVPNVGIFDRPPINQIPFPDIEKFTFMSFATKVEVTNRILNLTEIVEEYYNEVEDNGVLKLLKKGKKESLYYYNETRQYLYIADNICTVVDMENDIIFDNSASFYGWKYNDGTLLLGPSALLKKGFFIPTRYVKKQFVRGISCLKWVGKLDNVTVSYYFTEEKWTNPYNLGDMYVPVRVELVGSVTTAEGATKPVDEVIDFLIYYPYDPDEAVFEPPVGIGCPGKKGGVRIGSFPLQYSFQAEEYSTYPEHEETYINILKVWYDEFANLMRVDSLEKKTQELSDYLGGVTYVTYRDVGCSIEPLTNYFGDMFGKFMGTKMKNPLEVIGLTTEYYSLGQQNYRGIVCDVIETVKYNVTYNNTKYPRMVFTLYLSSDLWEIVAETQKQTHVPIRILISGYKKPGEIAIRREMNFFRFLNVTEYDLYSSFKVERCFPGSTQRRYFRLNFQASPEMVVKAKSEEELVKADILSTVVDATKVSIMRLPYIKMEYDDEGVKALGLMLEKPHLGSFTFLDKNSPTESEEKHNDEVRDKEECARLCVTRGKPCQGFHYCGTSKTCYLSEKGIEEKWGKDIIEEKCDIFTRNEVNDTVQSIPTLDEAMNNLKDAVKDKIQINIRGDTGDISLEAKDVDVNANIIVSPREGPPFPNVTNLVYGSFQTRIEIKAIDDKQRFTAYVEEYFDVGEDIGHISLLWNGKKYLAYYYKETMQMFTLDVEKKTCHVFDLELSKNIQYDFYGWSNFENEIIIGPSALLIRGSLKSTPPQFIGYNTIRGIRCSTYLLKEDTTQITYYFSVDGWTDPYEKYVKIRPIRVKVDGTDTESQIVNQEIDFVFFQPYASASAFQPPVGYGCAEKKNDLSLPTLPTEFTLGAEEYLLDQDKDETRVNIHMLWYSQNIKLGRVDSYVDRLTQISTLMDFNTGVSYVITDNKFCEMKALQNTVFQKKSEDGVTVIKTGNELLGFTGDFYNLGKITTRGIECDVWETVKKSITLNGVTYEKGVFTYFFSTSSYEVVKNGDTLTKVPVRTLVTLYKKVGEPGFTREWNVFGFVDSAGAFYTDFKIDMCFPDASKKVYFSIVFKVSELTAGTLELQNSEFRLTVLNMLKDIIEISILRIPYLKVDYESDKVIVTGQLLDRPDYLVSFVPTGKGAPDDVAENINTEVADAEACAKTCLEKSTCQSFYFCGKDDCYLSHVGKSSTSKVSGKDSCAGYSRSELNSTLSDITLKEAIKKLQDAYDNKILQIPFPVGNDVIDLIPSDLTFEADSFSRDPSDLYEKVLDGYEIDDPEVIETAVQGVDTLSEDECYHQCVSEIRIECSSFSYCPSTKRCRLISSIKNSKPDDDLTKDTTCNVFVRSYLQMFDEYNGKVSKIGGETSKQLTSATECARACKQEKSFNCLAFEFCKKDKMCVLHKKHLLDLKPGDLVNYDSGCSHYSAKFIVDYENMGRVLIDRVGNEMASVSLEQCARTCTEQGDNCKSFNYCPGTVNEPTLSSCAMFDVTLDDNVKTVVLETDNSCRHYTKRSSVEDWIKKPLRDHRSLKTGYTPGGLTGLLIGMIIFGAVIGVAGFQAYNYYRYRNTDGDNRTVKFTRQKDDEVNLS